MRKESFGRAFRGWYNAAGVTASAHGLRKLAATLMAEGGGSEKELQAFFGWSTNTQSQLYTREADKRRLAAAGAEKLKVNDPIPAPIKVRESEKNIGTKTKAYRS